VRCDVKETDDPPPPRPKSCEFDYGNSFGLTRTGKGHRNCISDSVNDPHAKVIRYGHSIKRYGIRCRSRKSGLRCTNPRHHGFFLSRAKQTLY
jgi:hypothetical protein